MQRHAAARHGCQVLIPSHGHAQDRAGCHPRCPNDGVQLGGHVSGDTENGQGAEEMQRRLKRTKKENMRFIGFGGWALYASMHGRHDTIVLRPLQ